MANHAEGKGTCSNSLHEQAVWKCLETLLLTPDAQNKWRNMPRDRRHDRLQQLGFEITELRLGLSQLTLSEKLTTTQAMQARDWLELGLMPDRQCWEDLLELAKTGTDELQEFAGGSSTATLGHPVERFSTWKTGLRERLEAGEIRLYEKERRELRSKAEQEAIGSGFLKEGIKESIGDQYDLTHLKESLQTEHPRILTLASSYHLKKILTPQIWVKAKHPEQLEEGLYIKTSYNLEQEQQASYRWTQALSKAPNYNGKEITLWTSSNDMDSVDIEYDYSNENGSLQIGEIRLTGNYYKEGVGPGTFDVTYGDFYARNASVHFQPADKPYSSGTAIWEQGEKPDITWTKGFKTTELTWQQTKTECWTQLHNKIYDHAREIVDTQETKAIAQLKLLKNSRDAYKAYLVESRRQAEELELMARTGDMVRFVKKSEPMLAGGIEKLRTSWRSLVRSLAKQDLSASISATEKSLEQDKQLARRWELVTKAPEYVTKVSEYNNKYVDLWTSPQGNFFVVGYYAYDPAMDQSYRFGLFNIKIQFHWTKQNGNTIILSISHYTGTNREYDGGIVRLGYVNYNLYSEQYTTEAGSWDQAKTKYWVGLAPQAQYLAIVSAKKMVITQYRLLKASRQAYEAYMGGERRKLIAELLVANSKGLNSIVMNSLNRDQPWNEAKRLYEIGRCVHTRANNGGKIAYKLQDRLEAGKISQGVKRNVGNPVLLIPAMMAANKQRLKLKSTIQTTKSAYQAAVAAVPIESNGAQKYQTTGQVELNDAEYYWGRGVSKDHSLYTPYSTIRWYETKDIKYKYKWSLWAENSQTLFYDSEKNALASGREEYDFLMATGRYTKRQARNIATAFYFDNLIKEDIACAERFQRLMVAMLDDADALSCIEYAPEVLRRQIRVAKWVVFTDRHPFLWQSRLKFKIEREKYLDKAINKWFGVELVDWENDGFFKRCWHLTERITGIFLQGIEEITGHILKWAEEPLVWTLNGVSDLLWGGDLGTKIMRGEAKVWHVGWYIFDRVLKNTALLPYRLSRSVWRLDKQFGHWIANGCHPKGFWEGLKKDTRSLQHLVEDITFAFLSLVTWGDAKCLMPNTAHRLHHEWQTIKFAANHPKIFRKQEQEFLKFETKSVIRTDAIVLKAWKATARNTSLIESPTRYFLAHEWRWINENKPKQAAVIRQIISTTKSMTKRGAIYEKKKLTSESTTTQAQQLNWWFNKASPAEKKTDADKYLKSQFKKYIHYLGAKSRLMVINQWSPNQRPLYLTPLVQAKKQELYATLWRAEKADVKGMIGSAQEGSKSKYQGRGLVRMNLLLDKDLATALHKSTRQQRRALGHTWAMIMALPTITSNLEANVANDQAKYRAWRKSFMQATSYDWSGMGGNEGLSITQSLVNAFIFSITSSATEKKLRAWTKGNGKGDGLQAFRLIILAYMAPNIQTVNSDIKQRYSLAQQRYVQLDRLDRTLITREIKESPILYGTAVRKDYQQLRKLDRKLDMIQRLGRVKITDARLKKAKQSWLDETLLVPVATLVQQSKRWSSLTAEQQETYSSKYTKWLTTNQDKKTRTLKKDIDRTKETSSNLHTQQQAWSSDQAAIASGDPMTVGQIVVTMKPIGNPDGKHPTAWQSVSTPDISSIQAGLERQFSNLASTSGTTPPAPTPAPAPNPEIKPVQLLTLYFQIRHFDMVYRRINRPIDKYWNGLDDAEIKGLSDAEVRELKELGWSDEKVSLARNILKTDGGVWQDIKSLRKQNDLEVGLDQFSELERQQLQDVILSRDGRKMKAIRESVRLEDKAAEKGIDDAGSRIERDLEQDVEDKLAGSIDNVVIDLEDNAAGEVEEAAVDASLEEEAVIRAEEDAAEETLETTIETADIAVM